MVCADQLWSQKVGRLCYTNHLAAQTNNKDHAFGQILLGYKGG